MKKLYEESSVQKIADTIREIIKTAFTYKISEMPDGIKDVYLKGVEDGGGAGIDTSDATATAGDMASGVTAYVNGKKITGNVATYNSNSTLNVTAGSVSKDGNYLSLLYKHDVAHLFKKGSKLATRLKLSDLGDASAGDVMKGKTFTSAAGITEVGTAELGGIDTSDATATAENIRSGKTAYVNGEKITGTLSVISGIESSGEPTWSDSSQTFMLSAKRTDTVIFDKTNMVLKCSGNKLGDATAADVKAGKTFTSAAGFKVTGTGSGGSSGGIQKKEGSVTVESQCEAFTIDTGLTTVHTIIVRGSGGSVSNTYGWVHDDGGRGLNSCQYRTQYLTSDGGDRITIDGGVVTCSQFSSSYPIVAKTFNWVAYGE